MKYLITGSKGQVGSSVKEKVDEAVGLDRYNSDIEQDISDQEVIAKIEEEGPDVIVHCAAITDLDYVENNPKEARRVNVKGTENIVEAAKNVDAHLIFISTDNVFGGNKGDYTEMDELNPSNIYAETKVKAEKRVSELEKHTIMRTSVVFKENFSNFFEWARTKLKNEGELEVIDDQIVNPTYASNLAEFIKEASEKNIFGTFNVAGASKVSRYEAVQIMKQELDVDGDIKREKMKNLDWIAERPKNSSLSLQKSGRAFETPLLTLSEAFQNFEVNSGED
ncbi:MAG: NAD(P)-dependent oxidoreductase [Candidatus Nanohalobium sp.]